MRARRGRAAGNAPYEQMAAANALLAENRPASLRLASARIGSCSMGTIQQRLAAFEAQRPKTHAAESSCRPAFTISNNRPAGDESRRAARRPWWRCGQSFQHAKKGVLDGVSIAVFHNILLINQYIIIVNANATST